MPADRERTREAIIEATSRLLGVGGSDAITTRAVAAEAGVQPPVIYRLFGDKDGLVEAVARHRYAAFVEAKSAADTGDDPVADLRRGWDLAVRFWLENAALHGLLHGEEHRDPAVHEAGSRVLRAKIDRVAAAGLLRLPPTLAVAVVRATADGAVVASLATPPEQRDPALLPTLREAMVTAVTTREAAAAEPGAAAAARLLRARLPEQDVLSGPELGLLEDWLDRIEGSEP